MFFLILLDADCSGRMLATILIAWVTTAMIASILLQWEHMWVVLVVLTVLFFLVCGYTVYTVKRAHARVLFEQQRATIRTISDITTANHRQAESSAYVTRLNADLPPSYTSVISVQGTLAPQSSVVTDLSGENKFEDPPPYSIAIASMNMQERNAEILGEPHAPSTVSTKKYNTAAPAASLATVSLICSR
ncbi:hypothetical protein P5V15_003919 [Pogonomyrmex californicus]